jgi:hypothetical protein
MDEAAARVPQHLGAQALAEQQGIASDRLAVAHDMEVVHLRPMYFATDRGGESADVRRQDGEDEKRDGDAGEQDDFPAAVHGGSTGAITMRSGTRCACGRA